MGIAPPLGFDGYDGHAWYGEIAVGIPRDDLLVAGGPQQRPGEEVELQVVGAQHRLQLQQCFPDEMRAAHWAGGDAPPQLSGNAAIYMSKGMSPSEISAKQTLRLALLPKTRSQAR